MKTYLEKGMALLLLIALCLSCAACQATAVAPEDSEQVQKNASSLCGVEDLTGCWVAEISGTAASDVYFFAVQFFSNGEWGSAYINKDGTNKTRSPYFYTSISGLGFNLMDSGTYYTEKDDTLLLKNASGNERTVLDYKREGNKLVIKSDQTTYEFTLWDKNISHLSEYVNSKND